MCSKEYLRMELLVSGSRDNLVHTCPNLTIKSPYLYSPNVKGNTFSVIVYEVMHKIILWTI